MTKALIIIDWEKEWINPDSEYYAGSDLAMETIRLNKLIAYARANEYKIVFVKHVELEGDSFKDEEVSTEFIDNLDVKKEDIIIKKNRISSFYQTNLDEVLCGLDTILFAGILINLCVRSAVQDAYDRNFSIIIVKDCCISYTEETQNFTLKDLKETRPEIEIKKLIEIIK